MLQKVEKKEHNQVELEFTVSKEVFDAACTRAFKKNAPKMNVPGFRRGKAPRHIIEKMYGTGVFYDEALNDVLPDAYTAAVDEAKLEVVSRPEFDVLSIDENGVVFKAVLYVMPEVSLSSYKGLTAPRTIPQSSTLRASSTASPSTAARERITASRSAPAPSSPALRIRSSATASARASTST